MSTLVLAVCKSDEGGTSAGVFPRTRGAMDWHHRRTRFALVTAPASLRGRFGPTSRAGKHKLMSLGRSGGVPAWGQKSPCQFGRAVAPQLGRPGNKTPGRTGAPFSGRRLFAGHVLVNRLARVWQGRAGPSLEQNGADRYTARRRGTPGVGRPALIRPAAFASCRSPLGTGPDLRRVLGSRPAYPGALSRRRRRRRCSRCR
jgi:hypothetical protein